MTIPNDYALSILLNGVEIIDYCPYHAMAFDDLVDDVSSFRFRIENPPFVPVEYDELQVIAKTLSPARTIFIGYLVTVDGKHISNTISLDYEVDAADRKIRLQKSVTPPKSYSGVDTDILDDLLSDTFPDLSDIYDFSTADSVNDDMALEVAEDTSLLDLLKEMADKTGAQLSFKEPPGDSAIITFEEPDSWGALGVDGDDGTPHWAIANAIWLNDGIAASAGNPGICIRWFGNSPTVTVAGQTAQIKIFFGGEFVVTAIDFDYYVSGNANWKVTENVEGQEAAIAGVAAWHHAHFDLELGVPTPDCSVGFESTDTINGGITIMDIRIDNIQITTETAYADSAGKDQLRFNDEIEVAEFDLDIQNGDEYGFNFDFSIGGYDDFNAVVVIGGKKNQSIEWTYHGDGYSHQLNLETPISDYTIYENTGSDASPSWTALDAGVWGEDLLTGDGGTKDVLYDATYQWLYFENAIADLNRAVRIVATIPLPIRVVVNAAEDGKPVLAVPIYDESVSSEEEALAKGAAELKRRNALKTLEFDTYFPSLRVGTYITVTDSNRGLNEQIRINRIDTRWIGSSGHAKFHVTCGEDEQAGISDMLASTDKQARKSDKKLISGISITYEALLDSDGTPIIDSDGNVIYERP